MGLGRAGEGKDGMSGVGWGGVSWGGVGWGGAWLGWDGLGWDGVGLGVTVCDVRRVGSGGAVSCLELRLETFPVELRIG